MTRSVRLAGSGVSATDGAGLLPVGTVVWVGSVTPVAPPTGGVSCPKSVGWRTPPGAVATGIVVWVTTSPAGVVVTVGDPDDLNTVPLSPPLLPPPPPPALAA